MCKNKTPPFVTLKNQLKFWSAYMFRFILLFILLFISHIKWTQTQVTEAILKSPILRIDFGNADSFRALAQDEPPFISAYYAIKSVPEPSIGQEEGAVTLKVPSTWRYHKAQPGCEWWHWALWAPDYPEHTSSWFLSMCKQGRKEG